MGKGGMDKGGGIEGGRREGRGGRKWVEGGCGERVDL